MSSSTPNTNTTDRKLRPTWGVVDYASEYKKAIKSENEIISSARYFVKLRREHINEIFDTWGDVLENMTFEEAQVILNEFLSPTCSLEEFEYRNLTAKGRVDKEIPGPDDSFAIMNRMWQKHILGRVLTKVTPQTPNAGPSQENQPTSSEQVVNSAMAASVETLSNVVVPERVRVQQPVLEVANVVGEATGVTQAELVALGGVVRTVEQQTIEVYAIYQRSDWFIKNVNVDTLDISDETKAECREAIEHFQKSYALTWKTIRVLCYLEILESLRPNIEEKVTGILEKCCYMIHHEGEEETYEMYNLNRAVDLFIIKYRGGDQAETLIRTGFGYLNVKMKKMKTNTGYANMYPYILDVATTLAKEELNMNEAYSFFETLHDFSNFKIKK